MADLDREAQDWQDILELQQLFTAMAALRRCRDTFEDLPEAAMLEGAHKELALAVNAVIDRQRRRDDH